METRPLNSDRFSSSTNERRSPWTPRKDVEGAPMPRAWLHAACVSLVDGVLAHKRPFDQVWPRQGTAEVRARAKGSRIRRAVADTLCAGRASSACAMPPERHASGQRELWPIFDGARSWSVSTMPAPAVVTSRRWTRRDRVRASFRQAHHAVLRRVAERGSQCCPSGSSAPNIPDGCGSVSKTYGKTLRRSARRA